MSNPPNPHNEHLTRYVAEFICNTRLADLPADVVTLGKKSILDGLGLALSGGATQLGEMVRRHFSDLHLGTGPATVIGSSLKIAPRFPPSPMAWASTPMTTTTPSWRSRPTGSTDC